MYLKRPECSHNLVELKHNNIGVVPDIISKRYLRQHYKFSSTKLQNPGLHRGT